MKKSLSEILKSEFIKAAKVRGVSVKKLILKHGLKGALIPVISFLGPASAAILSGSIVVEQIFRIPGVGRYFVEGALNRDYPMVLGTVIIYSAILLIMNFIMELIHSFIDPRLSHINEL